MNMFKFILPRKAVVSFEESRAREEYLSEMGEFISSLVELCENVGVHFNVPDFRTTPKVGFWEAHKEYASIVTGQVDILRRCAHPVGAKTTEEAYDFMQQLEWRWQKASILEVVVGSNNLKYDGSYAL